MEDAHYTTETTIPFQDPQIGGDCARTKMHSENEEHEVAADEMA
jgi:hypothetical protein